MGVGGVLFEDNLSVAELLAQRDGQPLSQMLDLRPPPFLFSGLIRDHAITMISAEPYTGKTMLMLGMAIALDYHLPLFGALHPSRPARLLFLGGDSAEWDYSEQARKLMRGYGLPPEKQKLVNVPGIWREGNWITDLDFQKWLDRFYEAHPFDVLFIDSARNYHDGDENDSRDANRLVSVMKRIRDRGVAVVFSHHTAKPTLAQRSANYGARGSSVLPGAVDFHLSLSPMKGGRVGLAAPKARGVSTPLDFNSYVMEDVETEERDRDGTPLWGLRLSIQANTRHSLVLQALGAQPATRDALMAVVAPSAPNASPTQLYKIVDNTLQELRSAGLVYPSSRGLWSRTVEATS